jgi:hypothetical protein
MEKLRRAPDLTRACANLLVRDTRERDVLCPSFVSNSMRGFAHNTAPPGVLSLGIIEMLFSSKFHLTERINLNRAIYDVIVHVSRE